MNAYILLGPAVHRMGALAGIFLPSLSDSDVSPTLGREEGRVHIHRHHLIQDQSAAAAVFWPNLTLLQLRSTDDAVMRTLPHAAGEEFCPKLQRPESFRTILRRNFLSSVKVATGSRERESRAGHADL